LRINKKQKMEDKTDKYIKELFRDIKPESPSSFFTENVMNKIISEKEIASDMNLSFFRKNKFLIIFSLTFISIFLLIFFFTDNQETTILETLNLNFSDLSFVKKFREFFSSGIQISSVFVTIVISVLMLFSLDYFLQRIKKIKHFTI